MTTRNEPDPVELLRKANPVSAADVRAATSAEQRSAIRERAIELGEREPPESRVIVNRWAERGTARRRPLRRRNALGLAMAMVSIAAVAAAIFVLGGNPGSPGEPGPDPRPFWAVAPAPGGPAGSMMPEHYDSLRSMTNAADLVVRARPGDVREGPAFGAEDEPGGQLLSLIIELDPIEVLAGELPSGGRIELLLPVGIEGQVDLAQRVRELEAADREEAIYFLRSGTVLAEIPPPNPEDDKARGLYSVMTDQGIIVDRGGEAVLPRPREHGEMAVRDDPVASEFDGKPYAEARQRAQAEADWRKQNSEAAATERDRLLREFYPPPSG